MLVRVPLGVGGSVGIKEGPEGALFTDSLDGKGIDRSSLLFLNNILQTWPLDLDLQSNSFELMPFFLEYL